jgi:nucleoside-diphosphate-sugar epimerase
MICAWLIEQLSRLSGREAHISRAAVALMSADQVVDTSRIQRELGWRPEVSFEEGTRRMQEWHRRRSMERSGGDTEGLPAPASHWSK